MTIFFFLNPKSVLWAVKSATERLDWVFFSPAAEETALDDFDHERRGFFLAHLRIKTSSERQHTGVKVKEKTLI